MGGTEDRRDEALAADDAARNAAEAKQRAAKKRRFEAMEAILYGLVLAVLGIVVLFILVSRSR